jgi:exodeoxyribonuclease V gamma subunit
MTHFAVHWGNRLERLADGLFDSLYGGEWPEPMTPRCIVTNSPVMQAWLRHYFVYQWPARYGRILANCDFHLLYPFVNDWMDRLLGSHEPDGAAGRREARHHPYAIACLQWRIYRLLEDGLAETDGFQLIRAYLGDDPSPRRRFQLAGRLATLFDDYQVYRCAVLLQWEQGAQPDNWQAAMWRRLVKDRPDSYAGLFRAMRHTDVEDVRERFDSGYRQVAVFGTTAMPVPYVSFFQGVLSRVVDSDIYVLNPSEGYWLDDVTERVVLEAEDDLLLEDYPLKDDPLLLPEKGHPLLCSLGQALQEHLHILDAQSGGTSDESFVAADSDTLLADLQNRMLRRTVDGVTPRAVDDSIQVHICHSPRREVEVLHDHLLKWLTEDRLQPYQVQVLVTDMDVYAPLIDAVFETRAKHAAGTIPYTVDGHAVAADSVVLNAFKTILNIVSSRFPATAILDLLRGEAVLNAFQITPGELDAIEQMVSRSGIRWGLDAAHREQASGVAMDPQMTWEYGLDRLLIGYALGAAPADSEPWPLDLAEGAMATALGKLARFVSELKRFRALLAGTKSLSEWHAVLAELVDTFLLSTNTTRGEVVRIRRAINGLLPLAGVAGLADRAVPFDVVASHIENALGAAMSGGSLTRNAVLFCRLRPMNSRPAEILCILGMNDGVFPRNDNRPTFDLLAGTRKRGDRSDRRDDRCAFLEALVNARRRLFLSYAGRTDKSNATSPPSIVLQELRDYLGRTYGLVEEEAEDGSRLLPCETLHRLQAAAPDYFRGGKLFSYSKTDFLAAVQLNQKPSAGIDATDTPRSVPLPDLPETIELDSLIYFFENPARHYYRDVLNINLSLDSPSQGQDEEPFELDTLERYLLKSSILEELGRHDFETGELDLPGLIGRAKADGTLPLGAIGEQVVEDAVKTTEEWMQSRVDAGPAGTLGVREILRAAETAEVAAAELTLTAQTQGSTVLRGGYKSFDRDAHRIQVRARTATIKTKDRMRAWIKHLFACATADGGVHTLVVGTDGSECYEPLCASEATDALRELVDLFLAGHSGPLPFAPESSLAYCRAVQDADGSDAMGVSAALRAAAAEWGYRDSYDFDECKDTWFFHAFGEEGPMAGVHVERFGETAVACFARFLDAMPAPGGRSQAEAGS